MDELSPAVGVTLNFDDPICEKHGCHDSMEISNGKLMTEETLLSESGFLLRNNSSFSCNLVRPKIDEVIPPAKETCKRHQYGLSETTQLTECKELVHIVQESEEDEVLSVEEEPSMIKNVDMLSLKPSSEIAANRNIASDTCFPVAVELEGGENGEIVAKVISLEESCIQRVAAKSEEEYLNGSTVKTSIVTIQISNDRDPGKGGVKSVFELECLPLWGSFSVCGHRPEMEDALLAEPDFMKIPINMFISDNGLNGINQTLSHMNAHFFGVYDGHGGSQVACYCRDRLHLALKEELISIEDDLMNGRDIDIQHEKWQRVFTRCFLKVDNEVGGKTNAGITDGEVDLCVYSSETIAPDTAGSTAVVALVCSSHIIVANCGDSRAVLYRGKEAMALSIDHKPSREDECARIEASGGKVIRWNGHRVFGVLAMSRSIGDKYLKPWIIPEPEVMFLSRAREDDCIVLATDGLWDVMTNEEVCIAARKQILIWHKKNGSNPLMNRGKGIDPAAQSAAEHLVNLGLQKGSKDNISVIVIDLKARRRFKTKS